MEGILNRRRCGWASVVSQNFNLIFKFGHVPEYRIGVHCGPLVTSEEGDTKRAIGFYGATIHIAARYLD
jgi:class 3 adenylate cyclase